MTTLSTAQMLGVPSRPRLQHSCLQLVDYPLRVPMNVFDGRPYVVPVKPGEKITRQLGNTADTDLWGLALHRTVNKALGPSVATLAWGTDGPDIRILLILRPHFPFKV